MLEKIHFKESLLLKMTIKPLLKYLAIHWKESNNDEERFLSGKRIWFRSDNQVLTTNENWWQRNHYCDFTIWRCLLAQFVYSVVSAVFVFRSLPFRSNTGPLYRWEKSTDTESVPDWFLDPKNCNGFVVKDLRFNLLLCKSTYPKLTRLAGAALSTP